MIELSGLSSAHIILLAAHLCTNGDVSALPRLRAQSRASVNVDVFLRIILTFLPESIEPNRYISVLEDLVKDPAPQINGEAIIDVSPVKELSESTARKRIRRLHLLPLQCPGQQDDDTESPLAQFLIHRAHRIDTETGLQPFILELLQRFVHISSYVRTWLVSTLLPLLRFNYEYYMSNGGALSLEVIRSLDSKSAVNILLSKTDRRQNGGDAGRDLRGLVSPWMYGNARSKRRKLNQHDKSDMALTPGEEPAGSEEWQAVNEWLLSTSIKDYTLAVEAIEEWAGPEDIDFGGYIDCEELVPWDNRSDVLASYGQAALATMYATTETGQEALTGSINILSRLAALRPIENFPALHIYDNDISPLNLDLTHLSKIPRASLLQNTLLNSSNPLTSPTASSVVFLDALLLSLRILNDLDYTISCRAGADICLLGNDETQLLELRSLLQTLKQNRRSGLDWQDTRLKLLWLRDWGKEPETSDSNSKGHVGHGLFWRIPLPILEKEILQSMLAAQEYGLASDIYSSSFGHSSLSPEQVEAAVTESIFTAYDNASNGNRKRGGIKRAVEMLDSFSPHFPNSIAFRQIRALISATHALSFYALTLHHGVPFQPVSIRVHKDPLWLIEKVLEQNTKAYTQLDNLLTIGRDLVAAGFPASSDEETNSLRDQRDLAPDDDSITADRRITSLAISSALDADDFGTAYSYVLTRLTPPSLLSTSSTTTTESPKDNISWRAAYNAGRHRSTAPESSKSSLHSQIRHLEQRMELLSLALVLTPSPETLSEILAVWRRCDEEMTVLRKQESEEAEKWDARGDNAAGSTVPGGFGPSDSELDTLDTERQRARRSRARNNASGLGGFEEAPMGLFDVARGAARAISKNAFPLRGPSAAVPTTNITASTMERSTNDILHQSTSSIGAISIDNASDADGDTTERVRKRDMVSNMVTGGLASGIGWVLGAQPVDTNSNNP